MESEYLELVINNRLIKINKNDSMDVWRWRDYIKTPDWVKMKPCLTVTLKGYKSYTITLKNKRIILSRVIYKAHNPTWDITDGSKNNFVDHINNNSIDNRIENLRILTHQENQWNRNSKGYHFCKSRKKWRARIKVGDKNIFIGYFKEEEEAKQAYLTAKEKYHIIK